MYTLRDEDGTLRGMICVYVNDFAAAGDDKFWKVMETLDLHFGTKEDWNYTYLGMEVKTFEKKGEYHLNFHQGPYIDGVEDIHIPRSRMSD